MTRQGKGYICGITAVLFWSTVASAFKISLRYLDVIQLLLYSSIVSTFILGGVLAIQKKFTEVLYYSTKQYLLCLALGLANPFLYYLVVLKAYDLLPAQEAQPINYTWALTLTFLSIPLLKQKIGAKDIIAGLIGYFGVVVISTHGNIIGFQFSNPLGVALALGSTVIWALYWIFNTKSDIDPVAGLFLGFLFSLPFSFVTCFIFSNLSISNWQGLAGAGYVGAFEMGITFTCWLYALKFSTNTAKVSNLIFISPFLALVFIHFLVGEKILISTFVGLVFITLSLVIQRVSFKKKKEAIQP